MWEAALLCGAALTPWSEGRRPGDPRLLGHIRSPERSHLARPGPAGGIVHVAATPALLHQQIAAAATSHPLAPGRAGSRCQLPLSWAAGAGDSDGPILWQQLQGLPRRQSEK